MKPAELAVSTTQVPPVITTLPAPEPVAVVWFGAEQLAVPPAPAQVHVHGEPATTAEAVPALHRLAVGWNAVATPLALPQTPLPATS